jgi:glutathionylspermidine synthase
MRRENRSARANWRQRCEEAGFFFHSMGGTYWDESVSYRFSSSQIDQIEAVTGELHQLCLLAAEEAVRARRFVEFAIPAAFHELVAQSWRQREPTLYGRFDFSWDGEGEPKLLEYNADTPTALLEASVVQWQWLEDLGKDRAGATALPPDADQFNSLHEKLIARMQALQPAAGGGVLHLSCVRGNDEDLGTVEYLRDCALQAGWDARQIDIEDLGWDGERFVDLDEAPVATLFKLYPWEWLVREDFGQHLLSRPAALLEPAWKMLLSNKALLVLLWEMNYGHPNLLPAYFTPQQFGADYVKKPLLSREGANVMIRSRGVVRQQPGGYGEEGFVYQGIAPLPAFEGRYPVIGSWIVGDQPAGIGIREDDSPITRNSSRFVPHYFT